MNRQQRKDNLRIQKEAMGKMADFMLDIIKLIFAGVILVGVMDLSLDKISLVLVGTLICVLFLILWYIIFVRSKRKG